jgi:hypothetical protein
MKAMRTVKSLLLLVLLSTMHALSQESSPSTHPTTEKDVQMIAPKSIEGLRMTFEDYVCYESVYLFWPDGRYTSVGMALPTCHSYVEMQTEYGKYEWHVIDSSRASLLLRPRKGKQQVYKFTFDTPAQATGYIPNDPRRYNFRFDQP